MSTEPERFVLRTTLTSPFGRKARIAADVLGLRDRVTVVHADVADDNDTLRQRPKIPCLVRADGARSRQGVILECLQEAAGTDRLMPSRGADRIRKFTMARLADGIIDAGALIIYEGRYHEAGAQSERWVALQRGKIVRALAAFERDPPDPHVSDAAAIGLACALEFLDRRKAVEWRPTHPRLVAFSTPCEERAGLRAHRTADLNNVEIRLDHQSGYGCIDASPAHTEESSMNVLSVALRRVPILIRWLPVLALAASGLVQAQAWPSKPVRIIVPISVGGATDLLGRTLAQALQQSTGQPFVVENKTGAAGAIGSAEVARAAPDGYTLLIATTSTHSIAPHVTKNLPYNVVADFTPIALLAEANNVLLMSPTLEYKTLGELLAAAKAKPGFINYSSSGVGSWGHLSFELFAAQAGVSLTHVPYRGTSSSIADLSQGTVHLALDAVVSGVPLVKSGRVKGLAVSGPRRTPLAPEIPTMGKRSGFSVLSWFAVYRPKECRPSSLNASTKRSSSAQHAGNARQVQSMGVEAGKMSPTEFGAYVRRQRTLGKAHEGTQHQAGLSARPPMSESTGQSRPRGSGWNAGFA
jgi:tripartite-type tricarboxylate transporter receptor subunit TctC/glutathione S-transferase